MRRGLGLGILLSFFFFFFNADRKSRLGLFFLFMAIIPRLLAGRVPFFPLLLLWGYIGRARGVWDGLFLVEILNLSGLIVFSFPLSLSRLLRCRVALFIGTSIWVVGLSWGWGLRKLFYVLGLERGEREIAGFSSAFFCFLLFFPFQLSFFRLLSFSFFLSRYPVNRCYSEKKEKKREREREKKFKLCQLWLVVARSHFLFFFFFFFCFCFWFF